jgi:hypothetical protein
MIADIDAIIGSGWLMVKVICSVCVALANVSVKTPVDEELKDK